MVLSHKHFTATAFVLHPNHDKILLHWHKKVNEWLPPGGHIENNEIPEEAVIREVYEESGLSIKLFSNKDLFKKIDPVKELEKPESILLEPIDDPKEGKHFHIDMIYFCKLVEKKYSLKPGWLWVLKEDLLRDLPLMTPDGSFKTIPEDVKSLAIKAFEYAEKK